MKQTRIDDENTNELYTVLLNVFLKGRGFDKNQIHKSKKI